MANAQSQSQAAVDVAANYLQVKQAIGVAARAANRLAEEVTLIAVSKTHQEDRILPVLNAGHRDFGENRVQEAMAKWPALKERYPNVRLHLIGPLQTNKVRDAVALGDVIHTVDRIKLARSLANEMERTGRRLPCFVEVNTGEEAQKAGVIPDEADALVRACLDELELPIVGLMCVPPIDEEPALHFALLREIARRNGLAQLSMGMTADYEIAIAFGGTHVRVGTAIFGPRE